MVSMPRDEPSWLFLSFFFLFFFPPSSSALDGSATACGLAA
jgi:hypothetical protein